MSFLKDSRDLLLIRGLTVLSQMLGGVFLARILGPHDRGIFALLILLPILCGQIGIFGLDITNAVFTGRQYKNIQGLIRQSLSLQFTIAAVLALLFFIFSHRISAATGLGDYIIEYRFLALIIPLILFVQNGGSVLWGQKEFRVFGILQFLRPASFLAGISALAFVHLASIKIFISIFIASFIVPSAFLVFFKKIKPIWIWPRGIALKKIICFSFPVWLAQISGFSYFRLDLLILNHWWPTKICGYFAVLFFIAEAVGFIGSTLGEVLLPYTKICKKNKNTQLLSQALRLSLSITIVMVAVIALSAQYMIKIIFGTGFLPIIPALYWLLPGIVFRNGVKVLSLWHIAYGNLYFNAALNFAGIALITVANVIFIPANGMIAATAINSVMFFLLFLCSVLYACKCAS